MQAAYDITRTELIATALDKPLISDDQNGDVETAPISFYLGKSDVRVNLIIMVFVWLITVFDFYLLSYLLNTFD